MSDLKELSYKKYNHLKWIYDRMVEVHKENPNYDYMIKLKEVIDEVYKTEDGFYKYMLYRQEKMKDE